MKPIHFFVAALALPGCSSSPTDAFRPASDLFAPRIDLTVGAEPKAVAIVDLDGDGRSDVVVARATPSGAVTVLRGQPSGAFLRSDANTRAGDTPYSLAIADYDKDGTLDVAVANYFGAEVAAMFGGDFQTRVAMPSGGAHPFSLAAADLDGDGRADLVSSNQVGKSLSVFRNQGAQSFGAAVPLSLGETPGGIVVGDLDGDGASRLDVAVAMSDSARLRIFHGQGGGAFTADRINDFPVGDTPIAVAMGRLDGDTSTDLAVCNLGDGTVSVLLGSQGGFGSAKSYTVGTQPTALAIGDIDGDGFADLAVSNRGSGNISILRGQPGGALSASGELAAGMQPEGIAVGDLNGDGLADVAVANLGSGTVSIFLAQKKPAS
jgi:hypothetical protein